jgi:hypothetical protein
MGLDLTNILKIEYLNIINGLNMEEDKIRIIRQNFLCLERLATYIHLSFWEIGVVTVHYGLINI